MSSVLCEYVLASGQLNFIGKQDGEAGFQVGQTFVSAGEENVRQMSGAFLDEVRVRVIVERVKEAA